MSARDPRPLAAFDLDGTLTTADTFLPFVVRVGGRTAALRALAASGPAWRTAGRDGAKAVAVRSIVAGISVGELREHGSRHAEWVMTTQQPRRWRPGVRPEVAARMARHLELGHRVVIVSASLRLYVEPIAKALGVAEVLATEIGVVDGRATGELLGANCRGAEKVRRIEEACAPDWSNVWAYGDSDGDRAMLERAGRGIWVGRGRSLGSEPSSGE